MDDLISRQAAIDFIDAGHLVNSNEPRWSDNEVVNFLKSRASAQPESRWIPCKTALPEKGQYVLCQCRVGIMDVLHLTDDNGWYKDSTHIYMHGFVLAWMPLPEPYREEGERDESD